MQWQPAERRTAIAEDWSNKLWKWYATEKITLIFLGEISPRDINFRSPGVFRHARWMSKFLYVLKTNLFRKQFELKKLEKKSYLESNLFVVLIYVEVWTACSNTCDAPISDLNLIGALSNYSTTEAMWKMEIAAISCHFWHFGQEITLLGLFSDLGSVETKRLMVLHLQEHTFQEQEADRSNTPRQKMLRTAKHLTILLDLLSISSFKFCNWTVHVWSRMWIRG